MKTMYKVESGSFRTFLVNDINNTQTTIEVEDASLLPSAPNYLTIGKDNSKYEVILYEGKNDNDLTDITREIEGTAQSFDANTPVARYITAKDINDIQDNFSEISIETQSVTNFTIENFDETATLRLEWSNPSDVIVTDNNDNNVTLAEFDKVKVRRSENDYPSKGEGTLVYEGTTESYDDEDLEFETQYYYSIWAITKNGVYSEVKQETGTPKEQTMDLDYNVTSFKVTNNGDGESVTLEWVNPDESDFEGVLIRRDTDSAPTTLEEGTQVADITDGSETLEDTGLTEDETYYYSIWSYNDNAQYSETEESDDVLVRLGFEYGLEWNQSTDSYTRLDDASDLSVPDAETDGVKTSDFDDLFPWNEMGRYNVADDGTVNAKYDEAGYTEDGSNGQVMVKIPKFYYKTELDEDGDKKFKWWISDVNLEGYEICPAFVRNGEEKDEIWLGAFEGHNDGGTLESIADVTPTGNEDISTFRGYAEDRGTGWSQQDLLTTSAVQLLYLIEYASFDSQGQIGNGYLDGNDPLETGKTDSFQSEGVTSDETSAVSYRGIENFWGSIRQFVDGFIIKDDGYYYEDNITNFNDDGTNYTHISVDLSGEPYGDGYQDDLEYLSDFEFAFIGNSTGGTDNTYIPDYLYEHDDGEVNIAYFGGRWAHGLLAGCFCWDLSSVASYSSSSIGARLLAYF